MLTQIHSCSQDVLLDAFRFTIRNNGNCMVFGPAGSGKTQMAMQAATECDYRHVYIDLSVLEAPDFVGLPTLSEDRKFVKYATPEFMPCTDTAGDAKPVVMIFDEVDKSKPELQHPLLEILLEHSINGRKLNMQAAILTGNLPDEGAFSQPVSHALTNRCMVFKLEPNFESWQTWAVRAGINPLVVGFLSRNPEFLQMPAPEGDPTAYCHPSARSWSMAAKDLDRAQDQNTTFQTMLVSGRVGTGAAAKFRVWLEHYRHIEPMVDKLVKDGTHPPDMSIDKLIVCAISATGAIAGECRKQDATKGGKKDKDKVHKIAANVMGWLSKVDTEFQIAAVKNSLDMELIRDWELVKAKGFMDVIHRTHSVLKGK